MSNPLESLFPLGTSVWYDNISRDLLDAGGLTTLVRERCVRGVTSNPTIFDKAVTASKAYDEQIRTSHETDPEAIFFELAVSDIQRACDVLLDVHRSGSSCGDGYVSMEVSPRLARDTAGTIRQAAELHSRIDRPNLYVKIPGTAEGLPAIEESIANGISINVTLLFAVDRHMQAAEAYVAGLERALDAGRDIGRISSVASFFVSRVDTLVDKMLEEDGSEAALALRGQAAIANAKIAFEAFRAKFRGERWATLAARGANLQRPLWASTSTKNPAYDDTRYVVELVGPHTVNTIPQVTIDAVADHGRITTTTVLTHLDEAKRVMDDLAGVGVDMAAVCAQLEDEGVKAFAESWEQLLETVGTRRSELVPA
ncbi:MAG: transaldolase [Acidimicrobiia bacterium]|nr:transaldolase [Acidimicrobiia bacterium]